MVVCNIFFCLMCWYNLVYITFSRIFEKVVSKEIALKLFMSFLSPFLYKVFIQKIIINRENT